MMVREREKEGCVSELEKALDGFLQVDEIRLLMCQRTFREIRSLGIITEMYSKGNKHKRQIITSAKNAVPQRSTQPSYITGFTCK